MCVKCVYLKCKQTTSEAIMKVKIDNIPTTKGVKFGFVSEGGYALRIGFRFASVEACMKYAPKHGLEVIGIA